MVIAQWNDAQLGECFRRYQDPGRVFQVKLDLGGFCDFTLWLSRDMVLIQGMKDALFNLLLNRGKEDG